jgi:hypothetical protein
MIDPCDKSNRSFYSQLMLLLLIFLTSIPDLKLSHSLKNARVAFYLPWVSFPYWFLILSRLIWRPFNNILTKLLSKTVLVFLRLRLLNRRCILRNCNIPTYFSYCYSSIFPEIFCPADSVDSISYRFAIAGIMFPVT